MCALNLFPSSKACAALELLHVFPTSFHWQKTKAYCSLLSENICFPRLFLPLLIRKGFQQSKSSLSTRSSRGWFETEALWSPPSKSSPDWAGPGPALPSPCSLQHLLHPLTGPLEKTMFQLQTMPRRYWAHPEYLLYCTLNMLLWEPALLTYTLHFLPARPLITMVHPQMTRMKLPVVLLVLLYSVTKGNILTPGTKPMALLLMSYDKELNTGVTWKQRTRVTVPKKSTTQSVFIFNLIFF